MPNDGKLAGSLQTSMSLVFFFFFFFFFLYVYIIIIIENLPTPTAGIPFVRLDPYLVPPDGLYGGPKSLPDGGESSLISGELSSTLQMGKSNSPFMWRTRPTRSGYRQLKTRYIIKHYNNILYCSFTWVRVVACIETHFLGCASIHRGLCLLSMCVRCAQVCTGVCVCASGGNCFCNREMETAILCDGTTHVVSHIHIM